MMKPSPIHIAPTLNTSTCKCSHGGAAIISFWFLVLVGCCLKNLLLMHAAAACCFQGATAYCFQGVCTEFIISQCQPITTTPDSWGLSPTISEHGYETKKLGLCLGRKKYVKNTHQET
ncbi:hypothetical protein DUNSADRAFT_16637 [Dunaliella salina]|uniref:Encoded protein n=1 Tax=Dunaliella salina TaxID=3046 RepID=A0ABQ7G373_DUNSA|nr:hypothetical protein DUNSADRAFT_16637 [Dunaliella salina]|eukprot:KAF5829053.1 hypothetical protein DUNSADRAFT_16637 [Dunaliella salina]